jgi:hypothetical protein
MSNQTKSQLRKEPRSGSVDRLGRRMAWSASKSEEVIAGIYLVAALLAWNGGIMWLAVILFIKSAADTVCSIGMAIAENRAESEEPPTAGSHLSRPTINPTNKNE